MEYYYKHARGYIRTKHKLEDEGPLPEGVTRSTEAKYRQYLEAQKQADAEKQADPTHIRAKEMAQLHRNLDRTDYQAIKYAEGVMTEEEYATIKAQRQAWRARLNELEAEEDEK